MLIRQMALDKPIPNTMVVVEPKAKKNYKTKNERKISKCPRIDHLKANHGW